MTTPNTPQLVDGFGRVHNNLRVSVTDRCNIRCFYCMPADHAEFMERSELLTYEEIERVVQILSRRKKNNPVLIGEPGIGKTAIVEGLAQKIVEKNIPQILESKRVVNLDMASMVAGTKYRGQFEERLKALMVELQKNDNVIIFIDELHTIVGAGGSEGATIILQRRRRLRCPILLRKLLPGCAGVAGLWNAAGGYQRWWDKWRC